MKVFNPLELKLGDFTLHHYTTMFHKQGEAEIGNLLKHKRNPLITSDKQYVALISTQNDHFQYLRDYRMKEIFYGTMP